MRSERGNVAIITALAIVPLLAILGGGVDILRATTMSARLSSAVDSATLAAANLTNSADVETVINEYIDTNFVGREDVRDTINLTFDADTAINAKTISVSATGHIDTYFLGLFGIRTLPIRSASVATQSKTNVEIALVLDISSSMRGSRIANLKTASDSFVRQILDDEDSRDVTSISVIPFGGTVNVGEDLFNAYAVSLADADAVDPDEDTYSDSDVVDVGFRFSDGDFCLEYVADDYDDELLPATSRGQVPHFWKWWNFHPWCPLDSSAMFMNSNDIDALTTYLAGMTLSDGTGMDIGAKWGLKALSTTWEGKFAGDFADRPMAYGDDVLKVLVVMTDGGITHQFRPLDTSLNNVHSDRSDNNVADGDGNSNSGNSANQQTVVSKGGTNTTPETDQAVGYFKRVCDDAKASGAIVYTIGFQISEGSLPDNMMQYCASDSSKYYHVESLDIQSAFDSIATSISALRVVG